MISFQIEGSSVPFARAGANGKRRFTPKKQNDFMSVVRDRSSRAMRGATPLTGAVEVTMRFTYLVPESWSKKKRAAAVWKSNKPDADNLYKIVADAMNEIVYVDDAQVASLIVQKKYGPFCGLVVSVLPLEDGL